MSERPISEKLNDILPFLSPVASAAQICAALSKLSPLINDVRKLEEENLKLQARIQELDKS